MSPLNLYTVGEVRSRSVNLIHDHIVYLQHLSQLLKDNIYFNAGNIAATIGFISFTNSCKKVASEDSPLGLKALSIWYLFHLIIHKVDLDNYVEFKSISRTGWKSSPDKVLPRCEIIKLRPKLLQQRKLQLLLVQRFKDQLEKEVTTTISLILE